VTACEADAPVRILIVDDRIENRMALRSLLASPACEVVEAGSGQEALLCLLQGGSFAALLVDVFMPGMCGLELAGLVRQREQTAALPVLLMTAGDIERDLIIRAYRLGAVDFLVKPLIPEVVRAKVAVFAELFRQRRRVEYQAKLLVEATRSEGDLKILELRVAAERRFRRMADAIPHIIWTARPDGTVDYFNRRWFEYTGLSVQEANGSWLSAVHPDDVDRCRAQWLEADIRGESREVECRLRRAIDGRYRWHLCRALLQRGPTGEIEGWLGTFTDVEEQSRERAVLAEFKGTLDAVQDVVLIFDANSWRVLYVSDGAGKTLGYTGDELMRLSPV
jgi:PAS domain S-box-containing protein